MVDVNQIVRETLSLRSYEQTLANITIIEALAAGLPLAFADPHQFQQVLLNLIINAEQAMLAANRPPSLPWALRAMLRVPLLRADQLHQAVKEVLAVASRIPRAAVEVDER